MQLGKTHFVRVLDDEGVDVWDIYARFDDRRAHEHLRFALGHVLHDGGEHILIHLPVRDADGYLVIEHLADLYRGALDGVDAVVQIINLPAALYLAAYRVAEYAPVVLHDEGLHRQAILRRLVDRRHVAYAGKRHVERSRYGRCRQRENIDAAAHFLYVLLVANAEALLLVDDEKPEVFEFDILLQKPVSADNEVALAGFQVFERFTYLRRGAEAAEHLDGDRKAEKALHGGLIMLLGKHRRRNEYRRLTVIENALHRRAKGDLGFAVADVAAQKTVHRRRRLHIGLYLGDAAQLIVGLRVAEVILKLALPGRIGREGVAGNAGALGVELYELACQLFCRGLGAAPRLCPLRAAHFRELNVLILGRAEIFRHHVQRSRGNVQRVCSGVADHDIILFEAVDLHLFYAREAAYAVHLVNDEVARLEVGVGVYALSV